MGGVPEGPFARVKQRTCLWCGKGFKSTHEANRKCGRCKARKNTAGRLGRAAFEVPVRVGEYR